MFLPSKREFRNVSRRETLLFQKIAHIAFGGGLHPYSKRIIVRKRFLRQAKFWKIAIGYP